MLKIKGTELNIAILVTPLNSVPFIPFGRINLLGFVSKDDELNLGFVVSGYSAYYETTSWTLMSEGGFGISDLEAVVY